MSRYEDLIMRNLIRWMNGEPSPLIKLVAYPTSRCNMDCTFCPSPVSRRTQKLDYKDELSTEEWLAVTDDGIRMGVKEWSLCGGGEPMVRGDVVMAMVERIKAADRGAYCEIMSNGTLFKDEMIERLVEWGVDLVQVSLDSYEPTVHNRLRTNPRAFERSVRAVKEFRRHKERLGIDSPEICTNTILTSYLAEEPERVIHFAHEIGVDRVTLHQMAVYEETRETVKDYIVTDDQFREIAGRGDELRRLAESLGIRFDFVGVEDMEEQLGCGEGDPHSGDNPRKPSENPGNSGNPGGDPGDNPGNPDNNPGNPGTPGKSGNPRNPGATRNPPPGANPIPQSVFLRAFCYEPWYAMLVDMNGFAAPCQHASSGYTDADLRKLGLEGAWYGERFTKLREGSLNRRPFEMCWECGQQQNAEAIRRELAARLGEKNG